MHIQSFKLKILQLLREINELEKSIIFISIYENKINENEIREKIKQTNQLIIEKKEEIINLEQKIKTIQLDLKIQKANQINNLKNKNENENTNELENNKYVNVINVENKDDSVNNINSKYIEKNKKEMILNQEKKRLKEEKLLNIKH